MSFPGEVDDGDISPEKVVRVYLPTYKMGPDPDKKFRPSIAKEIGEQILKEHLANVEFSDDKAAQMSITLCDKIKSQIIEHQFPRYKIMVQVSIGEKKSHSVQVASRCLWDPKTDNYASANFQNETLWAVAIIFGMYTE